MTEQEQNEVEKVLFLMERFFGSDILYHEIVQVTPYVHVHCKLAQHNGQYILTKLTCMISNMTAIPL